MLIRLITNIVLESAIFNLYLHIYIYIFTLYLPYISIFHLYFTHISPIFHHERDQIRLCVPGPHRLFEGLLHQCCGLRPRSPGRSVSSGDATSTSDDGWIPKSHGEYGMGYTISDWWFQTMEFYVPFHILGMSSLSSFPIWRTPSFFKMVETTNQ